MIMYVLVEFIKFGKKSKKRFKFGRLVYKKNKTKFKNLGKKASGGEFFQSNLFVETKI